MAVTDATPCFLYAAKTTENLRGSIPDRLRECRRVIEREGARLVVGEYVDESFSAFHRSRGPGLVDAMRHAENLAEERGSSELWALHSDRLSRGDGRTARHAVEIALWALKHDVRVRPVQDPDTFRDLLYAVVTAQRNHEDSRRRGLTIAAGHRRAVAIADASPGVVSLCGWLSRYTMRPLRREEHGGSPRLDPRAATRVPGGRRERRGPHDRR